MVTIAYDYPIADFISRLDATGHVSHTQHRKTKVTLHHNGGRLSHEGVLSVWQVRPASAHFNVDGPGNAAQFVRVNEYAWATGSTVGNQESISIEMCNQTLGPDWVVGEQTWRGAARLAGWLFARVIGTRPTSATLVRHKWWSSTDCAGPYIDRMYSQILLLAQQHYDRFVSGQEEKPMGDFSSDDRILLQTVWSTVDAMSQGLGERRIEPKKGEELKQVKHNYEVQHNLRNFLAMKSRGDYTADQPGPLPGPGEDFEIVKFLQRLDQRLDRIEKRIGLSDHTSPISEV